jgi:hypothetical protein
MNLDLTKKGMNIFQQVKHEFDEFNQLRFAGIKANQEQLIELNTILRARLENNLKSNDRLE